MPKLLLKYAIGFSLLFFITEPVTAQAVSDSSVFSQSVVNLIDRFNGEIGQAARIYNGFVYNNYPSSVQGNANLDDLRGAENGTIDYDGQTFENVPIIYDIYADQVVVILNSYPGPCRLVSDKIAYFDLHHHHFIRVNNNDLGIKVGFYDELYGGRSQVLNKLEKKLISVSKQSSGIDHYFQPVQDFHQYYIFKNGKYYSVDGLNSVLNLFKDKKKELKKYIKDKNIQFDGLKEYALATIAAEYDRLNK